MSVSATSAFPINELIASRWSPFAFEDRSVSENDLRALFEAARWSASAANEQPWSSLSISWRIASKTRLAEIRHLLAVPTTINIGRRRTNEFEAFILTPTVVSSPRERGTGAPLAADLSYAYVDSYTLLTFGVFTSFMSGDTNVHRLDLFRDPLLLGQ
jgi:nitroreductase